MQKFDDTAYPLHFCASITTPHPAPENSAFLRGLGLASDDATNAPASEPITAFSGGVTGVADALAGRCRLAAREGGWVAVVRAAV